MLIKTADRCAVTLPLAMPGVQLCEGPCKGAEEATMHRWLIVLSAFLVAATSVTAAGVATLLRTGRRRTDRPPR